MVIGMNSTTSITSAASLLNATESDAAAFVECVALWMAKGHDIRAAIAKHMEVMTALANNAVKVAEAIKANDDAMAALYTRLRSA